MMTFKDKVMKFKVERKPVTLLKLMPTFAVATVMLAFLFVPMEPSGGFINFIPAFGQTATTACSNAGLVLNILTIFIPVLVFLGVSAIMNGKITLEA